MATEIDGFVIFVKDKLHFIGVVYFFLFGNQRGKGGNLYRRLLKQFDEQVDDVAGDKWFVALHVDDHIVSLQTKLSGSFSTAVGARW